MSKEKTHPTDALLIKTIDRELSPSRRMAVRRHLTACEECRLRFNAFEAAALDSATIWRNRARNDRLAVDALRGRLQKRMVEARSEWDRSFRFRVRRIVGSVPVVVRAGLSVLLVAVGFWFVRSAGVGVPMAGAGTQSLPIGYLTPGATANVTVADLCSGSEPTEAIVPLAVRQRVLQQYRMEHVPVAEYELDYLITPELGGIGDARNLWPERYDSGLWNARVKDDLEELLSGLVCSGSIDLAVAQREIATNWIEAYKRHFKTDRPVSRRAGVDDEPVRFDSPPAPVASALLSLARPRFGISTTSRGSHS